MIEKKSNNIAFVMFKNVDAYIFAKEKIEDSIYKKDNKFWNKNLNLSNWSVA